jgi:hypothetical protein
MAFNDSRPAPYFNAPPVCVIHQKQERLAVFGNIFGRDISPVAGEIREADHMLVEDSNETLGAFPMLRIGLTVGAVGREIGGVDAGEEPEQIVGDRGAEPPMRLGSFQSSDRLELMRHGARLSLKDILISIKRFWDVQHEVRT